MDKNTVIKGLECCTSYDMCNECPYKKYKDYYAVICQDKVEEDALALLKAQRETIDELISAEKALKLLKEQEAVIVHDPGAFCPQCGWLLYPEDHPKFCGNCGQTLKWELLK